MNGQKLLARITRALTHIEVTLVALLLVTGVNLGPVVAIIVVGGR